ncbi:hypothetical protein BDW71DRAFT_173395 [Aspergillus fruticulosus]
MSLALSCFISRSLALLFFLFLFLFLFLHVKGYVHTLHLFYYSIIFRFSRIYCTVYGLPRH